MKMNISCSTSLVSKHGIIEVSHSTKMTENDHLRSELHRAFVGFYSFF